MRAYAWCGLTLLTEIEFPELPESTRGGREWRLTLARGRAPRRSGRRWFHRWRFPDGRRWVAFARDPIGYVLRFPGLVDFDVRPDQHVIDCYVSETTPPNTLRHLALDQVLPLVVGTRDSIALHGSVIATPSGAVALLGQSGIGKSTLAALLGSRGFTVLSDDCCVVERGERGFTVVPSYAGVRLNPDSLEQAFAGRATGDPVSHYSQKRRIGDRLLAFSGRPVPLSRLYVIGTRDELEAADAISIRDISKRDAMYALIDYTFHLDIGHSPRLRETFELSAAILDHYRVSKLLYPWNLGGSDALADAVLKNVIEGEPAR